MTNVQENFPCNPVTEYGIAKKEAENMCLDSGISTRIARCFAFVGPRLALDIHFAIGNFIRNGLNKEKIIINGDGTPYRSYLYRQKSGEHRERGGKLLFHHGWRRR